MLYVYILQKKVSKSKISIDILLSSKSESKNI